MARNPRRTARSNELSSQIHKGTRGPIGGLATLARKFIAIVSGSILLLFAWIQIKDVQVGETLQKMSPELLIKTSLIIYYAGWVGGTNFDTNYQQRAYLVDPKRGHVTMEAFILVTIFGGAALALLWVRSDEKLFAILLGVFTISNIMGWRYIVRRVRPIIVASRSKFIELGDYFGLEQLNIVDTYMTGRWQRHKFIAILVMVVLTCIVTFSDDVRFLLGKLVNSSVPDISVETMAKLLPGLCLLIFVLAAEGWIWAKRLGVWSACLVIAKLEERYDLKLR